MKAVLYLSAVFAALLLGLAGDVEGKECCLIHLQ